MSEKVSHEWIADGVVHRIVEDFWERKQVVSTLNGAEILGIPTFRERAMTAEILRMRGLLEEVDRDGGIIHTPLRARIRQVLRRPADEEPKP